MVEKLLTISTRKYLVEQPRTKRLRKAPAYIRERVAHYLKLDINSVKISKELNNEIVKRYAKSMLPVKLSITVDNNSATVNLFGQKKEQPASTAEKSKKDKKKEKDAAAEAQPKAETKTSSAKKA